jgi:VRR-NUC domain
VNHDEIVAQIQARASKRGVLTHYCRKSITCTGDSGVPDLFLCGESRVAWIEVKTAGDRLKSGQTSWRYRLIGACQAYRVVYEDDLEPGHAVDQMIEFVSTGQVA